jgi:hypothetical protein
LIISSGLCISQDNDGDFGSVAWKSGNLALTRTLIKKNTPFQVHIGFLCLKLNIWGFVWKVFARGKFRVTLPWSAAHVAYSLIRPKSQIPNIRHDGTLSTRNFMLMMKKPKNLEPCTQKMCSLLPWYTEFPVYSGGCHINVNSVVNSSGVRRLPTFGTWVFAQQFFCFFFENYWQKFIFMLFSIEFLPKNQFSAKFLHVLLRIMQFSSYKKSKTVFFWK